LARGPGDLDPALRAVGQHPRRPLLEPRELEALDRLHRPSRHERSQLRVRHGSSQLAKIPTPRACVAAEHDVLEHREPRDEAHRLEGAADAHAGGLRRRVRLVLLAAKTRRPDVRFVMRESAPRRVLFLSRSPDQPVEAPVSRSKSIPSTARTPPKCTLTSATSSSTLTPSPLLRCGGRRRNARTTFFSSTGTSAPPELRFSMSAAMARTPRWRRPSTPPGS